MLCRRYLRCNVQRSELRDGRRRIAAGDHATAQHRSRARSSHRSRHAEAAPGAPILREAQNGASLQTRKRPRPRQGDNVARSCSKNPALASSTKHRATPCGMSSDRPSRGRHTSTRPPQGRPTTLRPSRGRPSLRSSVSRRPRSHEHSLRLTHPLRLYGVSEAIRVDFALFATTTSLSAACQSHVAAYVSSIPMDRCDNYGLAFAARSARPGGPAACTK